MKNSEARFLSCLYVLSLMLLAVYAVYGIRQSVTVSADMADPSLVILDAGHGGPDGGSSAADGTLESSLNLEVTERTDALLGLLGRRTMLTRNSDQDLSDENAKTIAQKKVSDIRNRVALVNSHPEGILVSIHQNTYPTADVRGAQVFYGEVGASESLAEAVQDALAQLDPEHRRMSKQIGKDVYLMNHITVPGILVECGFLSNPQEAKRLKTPAYQKKLASALAVSIDRFLAETDPGV